ncbi:tRNA pseudouridine(55) synthase TruB [Alicyclobacillus tolerans]|uniref:tRNA pseudouridine(55) synthase TruB n=1 Tax=Alicyclobacillus tolerans TaxID=90970 RepID=UPI001EFF6D3D|nr:tRNA pseudouridine(55) synthase TruB [Alicyclobacillus tolerans]MCF8564798.1 tRNA pseudouridine(55) synthase TruB [Alicyclobacillus tolerans]
MALHGVLVLDKPAGMTSHDVVNRVRRKLGVRKVGHAGTLDPDATGVLVLCVGDATRLLEFAGADDKEYIGQAVFGRQTDTDDASGRTLLQQDASLLRESEVVQAADAFLGVIEQRPPVYSAVHVQGKRAHELARAGQSVELPVRTIHIYSFEVLSFQPGPEAVSEFRTACSKGTYIRSLCRDWGDMCGVPAHMGRLRRVRSGHFGLDEAVTLEQFENTLSPETMLQSPAAALRGMPKVQVTQAQALRLAQGQSIEREVDEPGIAAPLAAVFDAKRELIAVVEVQAGPKPILKPKKVFWKREP